MARRKKGPGPNEVMLLPSETPGGGNNLLKQLTERPGGATTLRYDWGREEFYCAGCQQRWAVRFDSDSPLVVEAVEHGAEAHRE